MFKRPSTWLLTVLILLGLSLSAFAAEPGVGVQRFHPRWGHDDFLGTQLTLVDTSQPLVLGALFSYADSPLVLVDSSGKVLKEVLEDQVLLDLGFALTFNRWFAASLDAPLALYQNGQGLSATGAPNSFALSNLRTDLKMVLLHRTGDGLGLAFVPSFEIPTATDKFSGPPGVTASPRLAVDMGLGALTLAWNFGATYRPEQTIAKATFSDELDSSLGAHWWLKSEKIALLGELDWHSDLQQPFDKTHPDALESRLGLRFWLTHAWRWDSGGGMGHGEGLGTPLWRIFTGLTFAPGKKTETPPAAPTPPTDRDSDGLVDSEDTCPDQPEDKDNFEDTDGCPDRDDDKDGILEDKDDCPEDPEDVDQFKDEDGCPDKDNDGDTIPDTADTCVNEAEDFDQFEDADGCPEPGKPTKRVTIVGKKIEILDKVFFETGSDKIIVAKSALLLDEIVRILKETTWIELVEIQGHTDSVGRDATNLKLSQRRSDSVRKYLEDHGVEATRLAAKGYGENLPVADNKTKGGREQNRRVEFRILKGEPAVKTIDIPVDQKAPTE